MRRPVHYFKRKSILIKASLILFFFAALLLTGCGYALLTSKSRALQKEEIYKVYILPMANNSFKAGVENIVFNNLVRTIQSHKTLQIVQSREDADAILSGVVLGASYGGNGQVSVSSMKPNVLSSLAADSGKYAVNSEYMATLFCSFSLVRTHPSEKKPAGVWGSSFARSKPFPSANQLDVPGATSPLINESEFDRALGDLARSMMEDVHDSMVSGF